MSGVNSVPVTQAQSALPANQLPVGAVYTPGNAGATMSVWQGGTTTTDANGVSYAAGAVTIPDGLDVTQGSKSDAAATNSTSAWSIVALLKGILNSLLGTLSVAVSNFPATQAVSASSLPLPTGAAQAALQVAQKGALTATAGNTTANTAYSATFAQQVNHVLIANNTTANINYEFENAATAGSDVLAPGQKLLLDVQCLTVSILTTSVVAVNGSAAGNIVVRGWL